MTSEIFRCRNAECVENTFCRQCADKHDCEAGEADTVFVITFGSAGNMAVPKRIISRGSSPLPDLFRVAVQ